MLKFDIEKTIKYWRDGARYDMDTAKALYEKTRYPYALFMGASGNREIAQGIGC